MILADAGQLIGSILLMAGALLPIVNPLGDAPIFLRMTRGCDESTRAILANRIAFYSFLLLLGSMLLGSFVLRLFGLSVPIVQVAGGAVVSALGWKLLAAEGPKSNDPPLADPANAKAVALGRAFMPLTTPVTVDAGVISVAVTVSANHGQTLEYELIQLIAAIIVAFGVAISILLTYRYAHRVAKKIGQRGMTVVVRLSAFIMLCIGVGIIWSGIKSLPGEIGIPHLASPSTRGSDCPDQGKSPPATG